MLRSRIAVDLGTAYSIVADSYSENFRRLASSVAVEEATQKPIAFGDEAKMMSGRCPPGIEVIRPMRDGVIVDFKITNSYLSYLVKSINRFAWLFRKDVYLCIPWGATHVEVKAYLKGLSGFNRRVFLVKEPFAAALGAGRDVFSDRPLTLVDMGGGTTEISTLSSGFMLKATSLRSAGTNCDQKIIDGIRRTYDFEMGPLMAEELKIAHASVWPVGDDYFFEVKGVRRQTHLPETLLVSSADFRSFLEPLALRIENSIVEHVESLSAHAFDAIRQDGLLLTGGTSLLKGWSNRLESRLQVPIHLAPDPLLSVIRGLKKMIENPSKFKQIIRLSMEVFR